MNKFGSVICLLTIGILAGCNTANVAGNEVAVVEDLHGPRDSVVSAGFHMLPIWTDVYNYRIDDQLFVMNNNKEEGLRDMDELLAKSQDGQKVWIGLTLRYSVDRTKVIHNCKDGDGLCGIHVEARDQYEEKWIRPEVVRVTKDLATNYTAKQIYAEKRPELNNLIEQRLAQNEDLGLKGILVKTFVLDYVRLEEDYENEITATVLQDQRRIKAEKMALAATEEAKAAKQVAQAEVETRTQIAEAAKAERMKAAEAEQFERESEAVGLLAKGKAEAQVAKLKKNADYDGIAGERRMQVEIATANAEAAKGLFKNATVVGGTTVEALLQNFASSFGTTTK